MKKINSLPDEVFANIFSYFSINELLTASKVCSKWRNLVSKHWPQKELIIVFHADERDDDSDNLFRRSEFYEILRLSGPSLSSIELYATNPSYDDDDTTRFFFNNKKYIVMAELDTDKVLKLLIKECQNLESIKAGPHKNLLPNLLLQFFEVNKQLRKLEIFGDPCGYADMEDYFKIDAVPITLKSLILHRLDYKKKSSGLLSYLKKAKGIEELSVIGGSVANNNLLAMIAQHAPQVKVLHLRFDSGKDAFNLEKLVNLMINPLSFLNLSSEEVPNFPMKGFESFSKLVNLEDLTFESVGSSLTDTHLTIIASSCKKLEKLSVKPCDRSTNSGVYYVLTNLPGLKCFSMDSFSVKNSLAVEGLKTNLKELSINNCTSMPVDEIPKIMNAMPYLRYLDLRSSQLERKLVRHALHRAVFRKLDFVVSEDVPDYEMFEQTIVHKKGTKFDKKRVQSYFHLKIDEFEHDIYDEYDCLQDYISEYVEEKLKNHMVSNDRDYYHEISLYH